MSSQPVEPRAGNALPSATSRPGKAPERAPCFGFPPERRILRRADFRAVYDGGSRIGANLFSVFVRRTRSGMPARVGVTATRRVGKAVVRNRCKRLLREAVRKHWALLPDGVDVVLHARPGLALARAKDVEYGIVRMLPKAVRRLA